jgi:hypothetical protein
MKYLRNYVVSKILCGHDGGLLSKCSVIAGKHPRKTPEFTINQDLYGGKN